MIQSDPFQFQYLATDTIDLPDNFIRSLYADDPPLELVEQLRQFGPQQPLPVARQPDGQVHLLAGFACLGALRALAIPEVCCQILPTEAPPQARFALQLLHGLSTVRSSPVLQAHLLRQTAQALSEEEAILLLPAMGQKPHRHVLRKILAVLTLESTALHALHHGLLSPRTVQDLTRLAPADQQALVACVTAYRAGGSKQHRLVEMVTELTLRTGASVPSLLQACQRQQGETDPQNTPQQLQQLLRALQELYAPGITAAEQHFHQTIQALQPPPWITIDHCPSFEDDSLNVQLHLPDLDALQQCWPALVALVPSARD